MIVYEVDFDKKEIFLHIFNKNFPINGFIKKENENDSYLKSF